MKGRSGSTGVQTTHQGPDQVEETADREFLTRTDSTLHQKIRRKGLPLAIAGLVIALLLGIFFVRYAAKLYESWHERGLLRNATMLSQEGKFSKAGQIAQELVRRHPDSVAALSILADTAQRQNLEQALIWRGRIA